MKVKEFSNSQTSQMVELLLHLFVGFSFAAVLDVSNHTCGNWIATELYGH